MGFRELIFNFREGGGGGGWGLIPLVLLLFYPVHRQSDNSYGDGGYGFGREELFVAFGYNLTFFF